MLINLLVVVLVIGLVCWIVQLMPLPSPWKEVALGIVCLVAIVWLLRLIGVELP